MRLHTVLPLAYLMMFACTCGLADDAEPKWGHLKGRIVLDGEIPKLQPLVKAAPGFGNIPDESLVVDKATKGIANVVVYLQKKPAAIHPELLKSKDPNVKFQAIGGRYDPHVLLARTDQQVEVSTPDAVAYNVHTYPLKNLQENFVCAPGPVSLNLSLSERLPVKVGCDKHPWMLAWWVVLDHPYAAITGKDGSFEIKNLPVGEHDFTVWQEKVGYIRPTETEKFYKVPIAADETTSLEVTVPVSIYPR